jgi:hypothetical protein
MNGTPPPVMAGPPARKPGPATWTIVLIVAAVAGIAMIAVIGLLAAIAIPNFVRARSTAQRNACINNLRMLDGAKQQWALENKKEAADTPTESEIRIYFPNRPFPVCPAGGSYTINAVGADPACSIPDHQLSTFNPRFNR